jgi:ABC-2 type transport system permease protein
MIDGLRFGFLGVSDVSPWLSLAVSVATFVALGGFALLLLARGYKLRA